MPASFLKEVARFKQRGDRVAKLLSRFLLMKMLELPSESLKHVLRDQHGRPFLKGQCDFNLSHTDGRVAVAIARAGHVGIDIEKIRPVPLAELREAFTSSEWDELRENHDPWRTLYTLWTRKESAIKADGRALLKWEPSSFAAGSGESLRLGDRVYRLTELSLGKEYCGWVACEKPDLSLTIQHYSVDEILPDLVHKGGTDGKHGSGTEESLPAHSS